jgi:hypothetical protein
MNAQLREAPLLTDTLNATQLAVYFYDQRRADHTERGARQLAELYLRRKLPGICPNQAAVLLANALAERAERRPGGRDNLPTE